VTELESLIESKIYREDELESELERYKKMAGVPSSSRGGGNGEEEECEMCGELGHDLEACPICTSSSLHLSAHT
jgi:CAP-Gly domain-containing linker protein 1